jgi:PHP family Zn ribbon phosphoesterase
MDVLLTDELEETYDQKEMERIELGLSEFSELFGW